MTTEGKAIAVVGPDDRRGGRDVSIDVLRGLCIISMIASHLAKRSRLDDVTHPVPYFDGALGFFLLSGLLVGIVQRSTMGRQGAGAGYVKLLRRVRLVWIGHVVICIVALTVGAVDVMRQDVLPSPSGEGGLPSAVWRVVTLQINPPYASVLGVYVAVMLASLPVLELLRRGRVVLAGALVTVVYTSAMWWPEWSRLPERTGVTGEWAHASWFALFAAGVIAGWSWRQERVRLAVRSRGSWLLVGSCVVVVLLAARLVPATPVTARLLDKEVLGPLRLLLGVGVCFLAWRVLSAVSVTRTGALLTAPFALLGRHSLDCYLILTVAVLVVPSISDHEQITATGMVTALACLGICWSWAVVRSTHGRWTGRRRAALATTGRHLSS